MGLRECFLFNYQNFGIRGFFRGKWPHLHRELIPMGAFFWSYEYARSYFNDTPAFTMRSLSINIVSGGVASVVGWMLAYPFDTIKSIMQA